MGSSGRGEIENERHEHFVGCRLPHSSETQLEWATRSKFAASPEQGEEGRVWRFRRRRLRLLRTAKKSSAEWPRWNAECPVPRPPRDGCRWSAARERALPGAPFSRCRAD